VEVTELVVPHAKSSGTGAAFIPEAVKLAKMKQRFSEESSNTPSMSRNMEKWELLEYEMNLCKELVLTYVGKDAYGVPFHKIDSFQKQVKCDVCLGYFSAQAGMTKLFNHMRGLLDVHVVVARGRNESGSFRFCALEDALITMEKVEKEIYCTGYYGTDNDGVSTEDSDTSSMSDDSLSDDELSMIYKVVKKMGSNVEEQFVKHVKELEEFGDPDYSSSDTKGSYEMDDDDSSFTSVSSIKSNVAKCEVYKAARVRAHHNELKKLLKRYTVGLTLLPELIKKRVEHLISEGFDAIENRGYRAKDVMAEINENVGDLLSNAEVRRLFLKNTLLYDLDG
jgi:hypothetical protein